MYTYRNAITGEMATKAMQKVKRGYSVHTNGKTVFWYQKYCTPFTTIRGTCYHQKRSLVRV